MSITDKGEELLSQNEWITYPQKQYFLILLDILSNEELDPSVFSINTTYNKEICINLSCIAPYQTFELLIDQDADTFICYLSPHEEFTKTIYREFFNDETIAWYVYKYYMRIIANDDPILGDLF